MAVNIITRNEGAGDGTAVPASLAVGELAVNTQSGKLWVGAAGPSVVPLIDPTQDGANIDPGAAESQTTRWDNSNLKWVPTNVLKTTGSAVQVAGNLTVTNPTIDASLTASTGVCDFRISTTTANNPSIYFNREGTDRTRIYNQGGALRVDNLEGDTVQFFLGNGSSEYNFEETRLLPLTTAKSLGNSGNRWAGVYSTLGDFTGTVNAANVTVGNRVTANTDMVINPPSGNPVLYLQRDGTTVGTFRVNSATDFGLTAVSANTAITIAATGTGNILFQNGGATRGSFNSNGLFLGSWNRNGTPENASQIRVLTQTQYDNIGSPNADILYITTDA